MAQHGFGTPEVVEGWVRRRSRQGDLAGVDATLFELVRLRGGMRVLDLGAGSGGLTLELARPVGPG